MKMSYIYGTINVNAGDDVKCPLCGQIVQFTTPDTSARNLPVWCKKCRRGYQANIVVPEPLCQSL